MVPIQENAMTVQLRRNFVELKGKMTKNEAIEEANRCLYCYDAPCIKACPTSIQIPNFIKKIASGNMKGSATTILEANPIGASCARVCPTEELCEGACVLNSSTKPIKIGELQRYATDWAMETNAQLFKAGPHNGQKIAIVGAGPAGLSAARELSRLGYQVTIYEAEAKAGGLGSYGIVAFRLPNDVVDWEVEQIEQLGVDIQTNTAVGVDISADEILAQYDSVILAVGMGAVPNLGIDGEELEGVHDAIEFIRKTKMGPLTNDIVGKRVAVIGAGNTAIDGATSAVRLGADNVQILYRRTEKEMTAYKFEYEFAKQDGVEFKWLTAPKKIIGNEAGKVTGIECVKMKLGEAGPDGRQRPEEVKGSNFIIEVDAVIKAIGQTRFVSLIEAFGLAHTNGVVDIDETTMQTSNDKVFACGDVVFGNGQGEAMVVTAVQQGKDAAYKIHECLRKPSEIA
ncbi:NAD(P)-dependent oxidoreductase [Lysinibacillus capsici]|uniref:Dihydropyrimidine dehydrogenase subunit A n=1 Tax=Lysinibacillus capsici TaxID=2115968 RepID=A0A2X0YY68_9BACI|nr:NAD(P)-dependent oxidoreductase [Lysinibacillus capsici]MDP1394002.1 NAD(P)-dependent oxidoreductase [Lysinibacillus capsici]MDP1414612.1 NAD(P)-dependent oxidoreductase [Lysinibacillus capsici]MDP1430505.1 NAD(P)-dependent oxidoreductase [Lysinibacillus capsici]WGF38441.1 NAD(P)-dependent oxidoreductase [Lysinibacillus capsici]SPU00287.1 dihydropyrimidine dehydrogenase subunit A [Lysinibacillus capsici]